MINLFVWYLLCNSLFQGCILHRFNLVELYVLGHFILINFSDLGTTALLGSFAKYLRHSLHFTSLLYNLPNLNPHLSLACRDFFCAAAPHRTAIWMCSSQRFPSLFWLMHQMHWLKSAVDSFLTLNHICHPPDTYPSCGLVSFAML